MVFSRKKFNISFLINILRFLEEFYFLMWFNVFIYIFVFLKDREFKGGVWGRFIYVYMISD